MADHFRAFVAAIALLSSHSQLMAAGSYIVTNLGDLPGGLDFSEAYGVNYQGQVVGFGHSETGRRAFLWTPTSASATTGSMVDLGDLPGGADDSVALRINAQGQVVGRGTAATGGAFLWSPTSPNGTTGSMLNLEDLPGGTSGSQASAINARGQVVGQGSVEGAGHGFLWSPDVPNGSTGSMVDIGELPGGDDGSFALAINSRGQIAGRSEAVSGNNGYHAFLWSPNVPNGATGSMIDLGTLPGGTFSEAYGINAFGQAAGQSNSSAGRHAFLWTPSARNGTSGGMVDLGDLPGGANFSVAFDIDGRGNVVGQSNSAAGPRAFLWHPLSRNGANGAPIDLNTLVEPLSSTGWILTGATGINARGQIVGFGNFDADGPGGVAAVRRAFLLTPVGIPEPSTALSALIGGIIGAATSRRARH